ncbi:zinc-binding alcohol dehydrogenase family protein [Belliella sp. DSM 111904]|uniref:Zinc-binding alcohol dehydrogenase family protein n=1 Tax=Belliella filtrata TaxID=2923435 RepID=A0ABS9V330_9BACT|nr:zinc-binding alcohol dehydrogenase family protein [Belliella filtrata]MCH7410764.1 zinc-binding alcohol dehydrogenase family protein [Belliella filtrata]
MKYIVCENPGKFTLKETQKPTLKEGEVLIAIKKIGICGTDIHAYAGNQAYFSYPRILGHELAAVVEESNKSDFAKCEKVILIPYLHCGNCIACKSGKTNCCVNMRVMGVHVDGGMQEYLAVPSWSLLRTPNLSYSEMALVEPLAIAAHAIRRANIQAGEHVLVMGCGPIGLAIMAIAKIKGATVIALDINPQRIQYAKDQIGVDHGVIARPSAEEEIKVLTAGSNCQAVFDATGSKVALESGPNYMSHGGRYVLVGLSKGELVFSHPGIHAKESTIMCSRNATHEDFDFVINMLGEKLFPTESFITHEAAFEDMIAVFDSWINPETQVIKATVNL